MPFGNLSLGVFGNTSPTNHFPNASIVATILIAIWNEINTPTTTSSGNGIEVFSATSRIGVYTVAEMRAVSPKVPKRSL